MAMFDRARAFAASARARAFHRLATSRVVPRLYRYNVVARTGNFAGMRWAGVPIFQNVLDVWTLQEAISELRPALVIEVGTLNGGSALLYAQVMDWLGVGRVVSIDIGETPDLRHPRIEFIRGDSLDPAVLARVRDEAAAADGPVLVILDGDHSRDHVAAELEEYSPLVTPGSLLVSQDGVVDELEAFTPHRPGPLPANREFLARHPEFFHDADVGEQFGFTHHPQGWLRRR
jgi:cephalosporin hydroxylase